jgi:LysR family transcriptional activator of nhaA
MIVREQSVSAAASKLRLAQPTLSAQLKQLEENLDRRLFDRHGRSLSLTDDGKVVFRYADNIFTLGSELQAVLKGSGPSCDLKLRVGITVSLPKLVVHKTLLPTYSLKEEVHIECFEGKRDNLLSDLAAHELDLVLSDAPLTSEVAVKAFNHKIGSSGISLYGTPRLVNSIANSGYSRFNGAPFVLPTRNTMLRRAIDTWFDSHGIEPKIVAEFEDSALLKTFGSEGLGFFPIASVVEKEVEKHYKVKRAARLKGAIEEFFAISLERKVTHPAIIAIAQAARKSLN